ncbi:hypothetical protein EYC84_011189 [Monilinia fructicola]|uniref:Uncharacterized protein n=1 Tax=Monilinia fructicola TaxID=38448 RepID=A0A5M9J7K4_MONFR|nr:hypothetical protein EYC84_011189 [Monilinia fructicola]
MTAARGDEMTGELFFKCLDETEVKSWCGPCRESVDLKSWVTIHDLEMFPNHFRRKVFVSELSRASFYRLSTNCVHFGSS